MTGSSDKPLISVIIPLYNTDEAQFKECLQSLAAQTYEAMEVVIADDCSLIDREALAKATLGARPLKYIRRVANGGPGAARNTAIMAASGDLLFLLDSDDRLAPDALELMAGVLCGKEVDAVVASFHWFGDEDSVVYFRPKSVNDLAQSQWIPGSGILLWRSLWIMAGGYDESEIMRIGNEDYDFWISVFEKRTPRIISCDEAVYHYRRAGTGLSYKLRLGEYKTREHIFNKHRAWFGKLGLGAAFLRQGYAITLRAAVKRRLIFLVFGMLKKEIACLLFPVATAKKHSFEISGESTN